MQYRQKNQNMKLNDQEAFPYFANIEIGSRSEKHLLLKTDVWNCSIFHKLDATNMPDSFSEGSSLPGYI